MVARGDIDGEMGKIYKGDQEYTYLDEHWIVDSLNCTPENNIIMYVNYPSIRK